MKTATRIANDFTLISDCIGTKRALLYVRSACERQSVDVRSLDSINIYHFSDGSALMVSYTDACCEPHPVKTIED